jgi:hypothetical protein
VQYPTFVESQARMGCLYSFALELQPRSNKHYIRSRIMLSFWKILIQRVIQTTFFLELRTVSKEEMQPAAIDRRPQGCGRRAYRDVFTACRWQRVASLTIDYFFRNYQFPV